MPISCSLNDTSFPCKIKVKDEVMASRFTGCVYNLPFKKND